MASHDLVLHIQISAADYRDATRLLKAGNLKASPLTVALLGMSAYVLVSYSEDRIKLLQIISRRRYSGAVPPELAGYLADFQRGVRHVEDHEFDLTLVIDEN